MEMKDQRIFVIRSKFRLAIHSSPLEFTEQLVVGRSSQEARAARGETGPRASLLEEVVEDVAMMEGIIW